MTLYLTQAHTRIIEIHAGSYLILMVFHLPKALIDAKSLSTTLTTETLNIASI